MLAKDLFSLQATLRESETMFAYSGYVTENVRLAVGETLKQRLEMDDASTKTIRSVFAIFVEQMQNVIRYSAEKMPQTSNEEDEVLRYGILTIGRDPDGYVVRSGNLLDLEDVERVRGRLEELQSLSADELKALYKERLREGPDEHSRGAGVGLIEIARRASAPIEFEFMPIDENRAFFALSAKI